MLIIDGINVPETEADARMQNWRFKGEVRPETRAAPPLGSSRYRVDCKDKPEGTLCDAIRHPDGTIEAYYCNRNHLCSRSFAPP